MIALVFGATGQVGGALMSALKQQKHTAIGVSYSINTNNIRKADSKNNQTIYVLMSEIKPDWVFYPAGFSWVDGCELHKKLSFQANVRQPFEVAKISQEFSAGFTYYSSEYIFDGKLGPYTEESTPNPLNEYGKHKLEAEKSLLNFDKVLIVRTTVVYGPEVKQKNFAYQVINKLKKGEQINVPVDQITSPTYNYSLAESCILCAEREITGILNLTGCDRVSRYDFALKICKTFDLNHKFIIPVKTSAIKQVAQRPLNAGLDSKRASHSIKPQLGIEEGLNNMKRIIAAQSNTHDE